MSLICFTFFCLQQRNESKKKKNRKLVLTSLSFIKKQKKGKKKIIWNIRKGETSSRKKELLDVSTIFPLKSIPINPDNRTLICWAGHNRISIPGGEIFSVKTKK